MLSTQEFADWSKKYVLFLHITTRVKGDKHQQLLRQKGGTGFPYLIFLSKAGAPLGKPASRNVKAFEEAAKTAAQAQAKIDELQQKADGGDAAAKKELFLTRLRAGVYLTAEEITKAREGIDLSDAEKSEVDGKLTDMEVTALNASLRSKPRQEQQAIKTEKFYAMAKAGRRPTDKWACLSFWYGACQGAKKEKNIKLFEEGLAVLKKHHGANRRMARTFQKLEAELKEMKGGGGQ